VIEARGPLGIKGRHLYRVRVIRDAEEADAFEMPEDELEAAAPPARGAVLEYLRRGGLADILRANLAGGQEPPRVWLTYTPRGGVTHTINADRGLVGGVAVPSSALHDGKVFAGKRADVLALLAGLGLSQTDAEDVLAMVGTAP
jgi:hypothetical protein